MLCLAKPPAANYRSMIAGLLVQDKKCVAYKDNLQQTVQLFYRGHLETALFQESQNRTSDV